MKKVILSLVFILSFFVANAALTVKGLVSSATVLIYRNDTVMYEPITIPVGTQVTFSADRIGCDYFVGNSCEECILFIQTMGFKLSEFSITKIDDFIEFKYLSYIEK